MAAIPGVNNRGVPRRGARETADERSYKTWPWPKKCRAGCSDAAVLGIYTSYLCLFWSVFLEKSMVVAVDGKYIRFRNM